MLATHNALRGLATRNVLRLFATCSAIPLAAIPGGAQQQAWIQQFGTNQPDGAYVAAADGAGGVYVGGMTYGNLGGPCAGGRDAWLSRYDGAGSQLWMQQFGTSSDEFGYGLAADGSGGVFVSGNTGGSLGGPSAGLDDAWFAHFDNAGNTLWIRQLGTSAPDSAYAVASDGSGGVYACGETQGNLGGPNQGLTDAWLARFDSAGNQLWLRQLGTGGYDQAHAVVLDGAGGVYACGHTYGSLGGANAGWFDAWFARYDSAGNLQWIRQFGTSASDFALACALDGSGDVYLVGATEGALGGASAGSTDAWLARYDSTGNQIWIRQLGTSGIDSASAVAADVLGGVFLTGRTAGSLGGPSAGWYDAWLARYDGAGNPISILQIGTIMYEQGAGCASNGSGGVYVCGFTGGNLGGTSAGDDDAWLARYDLPVALLCEPGSAGVLNCPCTNPPSGPGRGCDNSSHTGGATLLSAGAPYLSADTLSFTAASERPSATSVLLQGASEVPAGVLFGQGVRCAGPVFKRLYVRAASAGVVTMPDFSIGDPTISARSSALGDPILAGQSRWYAVYYRDPIVLGGCPVTFTYNTGPTIRANWQP